MRGIFINKFSETFTIYIRLDIQIDQQVANVFFWKLDFRMIGQIF